MFCRILSFRSTKSTAYAITSFIFCLLRRNYVGDEPFLSLCLCPIWEYQGLFLDTFNARHNKLSIDFAWSGSIFQRKPSKLPASWRIYSENHQRFVPSRKVLLLSPIEPENSFSLGVKCLDKNTRVPKELLKEIKHRWCYCPEELEGALNWKAYDSDYFIHNNFWPDVDSELWEPNFGYY